MAISILLDGELRESEEYSILDCVKQIVLSDNRMTDAGEDSFTLKQLARIVGAQPGTLLSWTNAGLFPPAVFRGRATRYERLHLVRALAIKKLRSDFFHLDEIKVAFARATNERIESWARAADSDGWLKAADLRAAEASVSAGSMSEPEASRPPGPGPSGAATRPPPRPPQYPSVRWERIELLPGLELSVQDQPALRRIAAEIFEHYGTR